MADDPHFRNAGQGVIRQEQGYLLAPGFHTGSLPTASQEFEGAIGELDGVVYVCDRTGVGTWEWRAAGNTTHTHSYVPIGTDPNADRIYFWDDSAGASAFLAPGDNLSITGTTLNASVPGSGLVLIAEEPFSVETSVSVDGVFDVTYDRYLIDITDYASSAGATLLLRLRVAGVDASGANYDWSGQRINDSGASAIVNGSAATSYQLTAGSFTSSSAFLPVGLMSPALAVPTVFSIVGAWRQTDGVSFSFVQGGTHSLSTAYDGFTLFPSSGTITGTARVYGYQNSTSGGPTGYSDENARDAIGAALVAGSGVTITVDDGADTITIASSGGGGGSAGIETVLMLGGM